MTDVGPGTDPSARTVLVTGGTGALGPALVERLLREGHRVRVLSRGLLPPSWPEGAVDVRQGDVTDRATVARSVEGAHWVFHLAGRLHLPRPAAEPAEAYERVNVEGTRVAAEEAAAAGVARFVFFSTIAVYGATGLEGADEDTPPRPDSLYARTKLRGEEAVRTVAATLGLRTSILRLAAVYGRHLKGNYAWLAKAVASGWFIPVGPGMNRRTLVHEADVAEAALLVARSPRAAGRLYNVSDGGVHRLRDVVEAMSRALGRRPTRLRVPLRPARALAGLADIGFALLGHGPRLSPLLDKYTEDVAVRAERIVRDMGFHPRFDLESGWRDVLGPRGARVPAPRPS